MTIIDVIGRIDTLKPNGYKQSEKIKWLSELDGEKNTLEERLLEIYGEI